ncbi:transposase [Hymenobacter sp. GOD-10R]|uniref:transposase n=1 Tax=Hymenobacter sp. GOD-10R TaxID=3093922 RepID=UPI002D78F230|nr:transposase [Hymenobacter sp. GOD-10R]WRQ27738.1 transposase [Hymenobacter sp. GOD-10R]
MPNHFHLLLSTTAEGCCNQNTPSSTKQPLVQGIALALSTYSQGINKELGRTGALFQPKTKARLLTGYCDEYPRTCFHYIHQNPVRAGLAASLEEWPYSSYRDYSGFRNGSLCNQVIAGQLLNLPIEPSAFRAESEQSIPLEYVAGLL